MSTHRFLNGILCILLSTLLLTGCGFKLRGSIDVPEEARALSLVLKSGISAEFEHALKRSLKQKQIALIANAPYQLAIRDIRTNRRSITLDQKANVDEYELLILVEFEVLDSQGKSLTGLRTTRTERIYDYNADAATASYSLEKQIRLEMWQAISERIIRQYIAQTR